MLVLTRHVGQKIYIGDDITITIVENCSGKVKVGIEAPKSTKILRDDAGKFYNRQTKAAPDQSGERRDNATNPEAGI